MFGPRATMSGDIWAYSEFINFPGGRPLWRERERERERREEGPRRAITATLRSDKEFERRREKKKKERSH